MTTGEPSSAVTSVPATLPITKVCWRSLVAVLRFSYPSWTLSLAVL